jgi:CheY-like chemotaxis protein
MRSRGSRATGTARSVGGAKLGAGASHAIGIGYTASKGVHASVETPGPGLRVLWIDDDVAGLLSEVRWLRREGFLVTTAPTGKAGLGLAQQDEFDVIVIEGRLPDFSGPELLRRLRAGSIKTPVMVLTRHPSAQLGADAVHFGAVACYDKPLGGGPLAGAIAAAALGMTSAAAAPSASARHQRQPPEAGLDRASLECGSTARRWARMVLGACQAADDPRTVPLWGRAIGCSASTIEETCRLCGVKPRDARDLTRCLRALYRLVTTGSDFCGSLAVADQRTLDNLLDRAGFARNRLSPMSLEAFVLRQKFVRGPAPCLRELATSLAALDGLWFSMDPLRPSQTDPLDGPEGHPVPAV